MDQIVDLRLTLRYLGVPIDGRSVLFGDNESVLKSSTLPQSTLKKRHNALSYHRVREAVASDWFLFFHIPGSENPADILSKHWAYAQVWNQMRPILFLEWIPEGELDSAWIEDSETLPFTEGKGSEKITPRKGKVSDGQTHAVTNGQSEHEPIQVPNPEVTKPVVSYGTSYARKSTRDERIAQRSTVKRVDRGTNKRRKEFDEHEGD